MTRTVLQPRRLAGTKERVQLGTGIALAHPVQVEARIDETLPEATWRTLRRSNSAKGRRPDALGAGAEPQAGETAWRATSPAPAQPVQGLPVGQWASA